MSNFQAKQVNSVWPNPSRKIRPLRDVVHDSISVFEPINVLIDTPEFQRLRNIKQLGACSYVYPTAVHDRFMHSLGVYHLSFEYMAALRAMYADKYNLTSVDHLCVCIAALFHDIGHGPYSHTFEHVFKGKSHETIGREIIEKIFKREEIRKHFTEYLGEGAEWEQNILFIQELIHPGKVMDDDYNWLMKGRPMGKSFLYEVVSNPWTIMDVDKFDYLLRDSLSSGCNISFSSSCIKRILSTTRISEHNDVPPLRFTYDIKVMESVNCVGESRQSLHEKLYQHKTVMIISYIIEQVLIKAANFSVHGYSLKDVKNNLEAYLLVDDTIINEIMRSDDDNLSESKKLLENLKRRVFPKFVTSHKTTTDVVERMEAKYCSGINSPKTLEEWISQKLHKDVIVLRRRINRGDHSENPISKMLFYNTRDFVGKPDYLSEQEVRLNNPLFGEFFDFCVYLDHPNEEAKKDIYMKFEIIRDEFREMEEIRDDYMEYDGV